MIKCALIYSFYLEGWQLRCCFNWDFLQTFTLSLGF